MCAEWVKKGGYETRLLADELDLALKGAQVELVRLVKGKYVHYHKKKTECFYFLKGKGKAVINGKERKIGPGVLVIIKPFERHDFFNIQREPLDAILFKTNSSPEDTFTD